MMGTDIMRFLPSGFLVLSLLCSCTPNTAGIPCTADSDCSDVDTVCEFDSGRCISKAEIGFGGKLAYVSNRLGAWEVWVMNDDGSARRQITFAAEKELLVWGAFQPRWSRDGQHLAFYYGMNDGSDDFPAASRVMLCRPDGADLQEISADCYLSGKQMSWSVDDGSLLISRPIEESCSDNIDAVELATGEHLTLLEQTEDGYRSLHAPEAHPTDADLMAFVAYNCGGDYGGVRVLRHSTGEIRLVAEQETGAFAPRWSVDGEKILWVGSHDPVIHVSDAESGDLQDVAPGVPGEEYAVVDADWTEGGFVFGLVTAPDTALWICDADGRRARPILQEAAASAQLDWTPGRLPDWAAASCAVHGGQWRADGLGGQACWLLSELEQSCSAACGAHGLTCDPGNWNDDPSSRVCRELTGEPVSTANNPDFSNSAPYLFEPSGSSHGCYVRSEERSQDCDATGGGRIRLCVCRPFD